MADTDRPTTTKDEIDRTGRDTQVAGTDPHGDANNAFGKEGTPAEEVPPRLENDIA